VCLVLKGTVQYTLLMTPDLTRGEERLRSTGETGFRFRIWTPFSHLVLRQPVAAVFSKPKVAWDSGNLPKPFSASFFFCVAAT